MDVVHAGREGSAEKRHRSVAVESAGETVTPTLPDTSDLHIAAVKRDPYVPPARYYMPGEIANRKVQFKLDSGCTGSVIGKHVFDSLPSAVRAELRTQNQSGSTVRLADGSTVPIYGMLQVLCKLRDVSFEHEFSVSRLRDDAILGLTFLKRFNCCLQSERPVLRMGDRELQCTNEWGDLLASNVQMRRSTVVPPLSEMSLTCNLSSKSPGLVESCCKHDELNLATSLCCPNNKRPGASRCLNMTERPALIKAGTVLGTYQQVEEDSVVTAGSKVTVAEVQCGTHTDTATAGKASLPEHVKDRYVGANHELSENQESVASHLGRISSGAVECGVYSSTEVSSQRDAQAFCRKSGGRALRSGVAEAKTEVVPGSGRRSCLGSMYAAPASARKTSLKAGSLCREDWDTLRHSDDSVAIKVGQIIALLWELLSILVLQPFYTVGNWTQRLVREVLAGCSDVRFRLPNHQLLEDSEDMSSAKCSSSTVSEPKQTVFPTSQREEFNKSRCSNTIASHCSYPYLASEVMSSVENLRPRLPSGYIDEGNHYENTSGQPVPAKASTQITRSTNPLPKQDKCDNRDECPKYMIGDSVYLSGRERRRGQSQKLALNDVGLYSVTAVYPDRTYEIERNRQRSIQPESRLKLHFRSQCEADRAPVILETTRRLSKRGGRAAVTLPDDDDDEWLAVNLPPEVEIRPAVVARPAAVPEAPVDPEPDPQLQAVPVPVPEPDVPVARATVEPATSRSGRILRRPAYLRDYVT